MAMRGGLWGGACGVAISLVLLLGLRMAGAAEPPAFTLMLQAGRVSVTARDAPLRDILGAARQQGGFEIRLDAPLESRVSNEVVTTAFQDEAVETALHRLLGVENLVFLYSTDGLVEVRAYGDRLSGSLSSRRQRGEADQAERRVSRSDDEDSVDIVRLQREALRNPDPHARAIALDEMARKGDEALARDTALEVLRRDGDERVLARALTVLSDLERVPLDPILKFAATNRGAYLRVQALELLGEHGREDSRVTALLRTLSRRDPDAEVRESAKALLEDLSEQ